MRYGLFSSSSSSASNTGAIASDVTSLLNQEDDVPEDVKKRRLSEVINLQQKHSLHRTEQHLGKVEEVLIEKESKRSSEHWSGRNSQNTVVIFPKGQYKVGEFVNVKINECTSATLIGEAVDYSKHN